MYIVRILSTLDKLYYTLDIRISITITIPTGYWVFKNVSIK